MDFHVETSAFCGVCEPEQLRTRRTTFVRITVLSLWFIVPPI